MSMQMSHESCPVENTKPENFSVFDFMTMGSPCPKSTGANIPPWEAAIVHIILPKTPDRLN